VHGHASAGPKKKKPRAGRGFAGLAAVLRAPGTARPRDRDDPAR